MNKFSLSLLLLSLALTASSCAEPSDVPGKRASPSEPAGPVEEEITQQNLLARERFWPYRVALSEPHPVIGRSEPLPAGLVGVLIRVESSGLPRIDFGSLGKHEIPVRSTDLLERANGIRRGELEKTEPNFIHAIESRLLDSASDALQPLRIEETIDRPGFLCVFADPDAEGFGELVSALVPLRERHGVMTILFPRGSRPDAAVRDQLRALEWPVPFLPDFLSEPYARTLLSEETPLPYVMLQTAEGRVLFQGPWRADASELVAAFDTAFGGSVAAVADLERAR
jgi:hypothetical protein